MNKPAKIALISALSYLLVFAVTGVNHYFLAMQPHSEAMIDLFPILITFPWSFPVTLLLDSLGYITWYDDFSPSSPVLYNFFAMLGLLPGALINASIIYFVVIKVFPAKKHKKPKES